MSLLEFATKYLPELQKFAAENGDGPDERPRSPCFMKKQNHKYSSGRSLKSKKQGSVPIHKSFKRSYIQPPPPAPHMVPQWIPARTMGPKVPPHFMPPPMPYVQVRPAPVRTRKYRSKICTNPKKELKTGTMILNMSNALEDFKKRRDKFLNYLAQLQEDLNKLNLPSASQEKMEVKKTKEVKKKKRKVQKQKPSSDYKIIKKNCDDSTTPETNLKKKKVNSQKTEVNDSKKHKAIDDEDE